MSPLNFSRCLFYVNCINKTNTIQRLKFVKTKMITFITDANLYKSISSPITYNISETVEFKATINGQQWSEFDLKKKTKETQ